MKNNNEITLVYTKEGDLIIRLDCYLRSLLEGFSRTYIQDLIDQGAVKVNGKVVHKSSIILKNNDIITILPKAKTYNVEPMPVPFEVIDQQEDFLVINKPAGLLVHQAHTNQETPTLVNGLLHYFNGFTEFNDAQRPGIVHRIDKDTSGLLLVARNVQAQYVLSEMFKNRMVKKTYLAVVHGNPNEQGSIDLPIGRSFKERHKMSHVGFCSRHALTHYHVLARYYDSALIAATIVTGRTNQIRVHCAAIGYPVLGDSVYGVKTPLIARQALHAWKLAFTYKNKQYTYYCPVPDDIKKLITTIRNVGDNKKY
jgi:23S rRNA pseudouridine1911/1915/1917 synthase